MRLFLLEHADHAKYVMKNIPVPMEVRLRGSAILVRARQRFVEYDEPYYPGQQRSSQDTDFGVCDDRWVAKCKTGDEQ